MQVRVDLPESVFSILRVTPEKFIQEMRIAAAVKWYEKEMLSQSKATELAGISRIEFMEALNSFNVSPFQITEEELAQEVGRYDQMGG